MSKSVRDEAAIQARKDALLAFERTEPKRLWYFSFADENGFLGGIFTYTHGIATGIEKLHRLRINPGGEVRAVPAPLPVLDELTDRLISKDEMVSIFGGVRKWGED